MNVLSCKKDEIKGTENSSFILVKFGKSQKCSWNLFMFFLCFFMFLKNKKKLNVKQKTENVNGSL